MTAPSSLSSAGRNSATAATVSRLLAWGRTAVAASRIAGQCRGAVDRVASFAWTSRLAVCVFLIGRWGRFSLLYRWVTAEPDPDVVVIDLRETRTVGPVLGLIDRIFGPLTAHWQHARARALTDSVTDALAARPVRTVSVVALAAILTNSCLLVALGSPSATDVGVRLLALSLALAGTRVATSAEDLTDTTAYKLAAALLTPPEQPDRDR